MANKTTSLYLGNVEIFDSEEQAIDEIYDAIGYKPINIRFMRDPASGNQLNYGFIKFKNASEATEAMRLLKGSLMRRRPGVRWNVNWGTDKNESTDADSLVKAEGYSVYVGNIPNTIDDNALLDFFRNYIPSAINARIVYANGVHKGFGFVKFSTYQECLSAIEKLNNVNAWGRPLRIFEAENNRILGVNQENNTTLYISQLDPNIINEEILTSTFGRYGNVVSIKIDPVKFSWALLKMETHSMAESAMNALQGAKFGGTSKCAINWGRDVDDSSVSDKSSRISIPSMKPTKQNRRNYVEFYTKENIHKIINIIQSISESQRELPLPNTDPQVANRAYARQSIPASTLFDTKEFHDYIPNDQNIWYF
ncbi:RNA binding [Trichomonas vaginalis G3]|uniref:RNA binding n=1 Tax=Trichomonas vaginalis (strain ATCC PRA-98 / G3) TaxID=412133 RepID=UPI0021E53753|nr:RNA binding [Trichomonas vaginalis G3]KAI5518061.1 RNA binding [Trichomonas vaginalis G3]